MFKRNLIFLIATLTIFYLFSCKKDKLGYNDPPVYDTIKPLPFFPIWPGSWWEYKKNTKNNSTFFQKKSVEKWIIDPNFNEVIIPSFKDTDGSVLAFYGYTFYKTEVRLKYYNGVSKHTLISHLIGERTYNLDHYSMNNIYIGSDYTFVEQIYFDGNDSVIVMKSTSNLPSPPSNNYITRSFYKKNVGLFFEYQTDSTETDTIYSLELVNYHINH